MPEGEFIIGPRCIGIPPIECGMKPPPRIPIRGMEPPRIPMPPMEPPRVPIPPMEPPCPLIAVAVEAAKTHAATQPTRMNFFQFITLFPFNSLLKSKNQLASKVANLPRLKGDAVVTIPIRRQEQIGFI